MSTVVPDLVLLMGRMPVMISISVCLARGPTIKTFGTLFDFHGLNSRGCYKSEYTADSGSVMMDIDCAMMRQLGCDEHWEPRCGTRAQPPARFAPSDSSACGLLLFATAVPVVSYSSLPQEEGLRVSATNHRQALQSMINGCRGRPFSTESFVGLEELIIY